MAIAKAAEILSLLSGGKSPPMAILVHGNDRGAVLALCNQVVGKYLGNSYDALDISRLAEQQITSNRERLYEEFASISMFGGKRVAWLSDAGESSAKIIEPIVVTGAIGNLILVDAEALAKTSKLRKLFEANQRCVSVALYEESAQEIRSRLDRQFTVAGFAITEEAMMKLLECISFERAVADSEVQKLMTYCFDQKQIDIDDVIAVCGDSSDVSTDDLVDAIFEGNLADSDRFVTTFGLSPAAGRGVLSVVLQQAVRLQAMALQVGQGQSIDSVVGSPRFGVFFKRRPTISRQLRLWDLPALIDAENKICAAILQTRQHAALADAIESRTLIALSRYARMRSAPSN